MGDRWCSRFTRPLWRFASQVQRYRRERAASHRCTPALKAERAVFRSMGFALFAIVLAVAAMTNPTTPSWLMSGLGTGAGVAAP